jgi:dipeptidyl aminopeptidase/acylaminoacyl peptidase
MIIPSPVSEIWNNMTENGQRGVVFTSNGFQLVGTLFLARDKLPRPTAIILHGVPGIEKNFDLAHALRLNGWNSLIFHFRGSWGSQGVYALKHLPEDVVAAVNFLDRGAHPEVDHRRIIAIGHSLGGWAAILAATKDPRIRGLAVYGSVTDTQTLTFSRTEIAAEFTPWLQGISPHSFARQWDELGKDRNPLDEITKLAPRPLFVIHGRSDAVVPISQSQALFSRAGEPKTVAIHPTAGHSFIWDRPWLINNILAWLATAGI